LSEGIDDRDAALRSLELGQTWINNADTKVGLATAALALLTGAFTGRISLVVDAFAASTWLGVALLVGALVVVGLLACAGWRLLQALLPARNAEQANRFAWPSLTHLTDAAIEEAAGAETLRRQAWRQARELSRIADRKYLHFHAGAKWLAAAFAALALWLIAAVIVVSAADTTPRPAPPLVPAGASDAEHQPPR
jgi:hypothetical protein